MRFILLLLLYDWRVRFYVYLYDDAMQLNNIANVTQFFSEIIPRFFS